MGVKGSWQRRAKIERTVYEAEQERLFGKKPERVPYVYEGPVKEEEEKTND